MYRLACRCFASAGFVGGVNHGYPPTRRFEFDGSVDTLAICVASMLRAVMHPISRSSHVLPTERSRRGLTLVRLVT